MLQAKSLFSEVETLRVENSSLHTQVKLRDEKNQFLEEEITYLREMLEEFKRQQFGKKSERWTSEEQMLFNEVELESKKPDEECEESEDEETIEVKAHKKKKNRGKRSPLPEHLERKVVTVELPEEERFTEDGTPLKVIGHEVSEKLDYQPAKTTVIQYRRAKYGIDSGDYQKTAQPVPSIIPKGIATPGLLAAIAVSKFADGMPLYRQEEMFERHDIELSRTTMARWMVRSAWAIRPIINVLSDRLRELSYVSCDETRTQVLKEKRRTAESQSWMWVLSTPFGENRIVLFDYRTSRCGDVPVEILDGFEGYLQVDGYGGYNQISKKEKITRIGCNMHGRRYFEKAHKSGAKSGKSLADIAMKYYKVLFDIEKEVREKPPDERFRIRLEKAEPIWKEFKAWVDENKDKVPKTSKIGKAFGYFTSEYEYLIGYLADGRLEIDSGFVERCIRKFAIGRNNWMFSDTEDGAEASALLYSLVVTAKVNGVNPYRALRYIFEEIPKAQTLEDVERLADIIIASQPIP